MIYASVAPWVFRRYTKRLATRIHERAMELPLYRMVVERLGLK
jgi:hypothetical protein